MLERYALPAAAVLSALAMLAALYVSAMWPPEPRATTWHYDLSAPDPRLAN